MKKLFATLIVVLLCVSCVSNTPSKLSKRELLEKSFAHQKQDLLAKGMVKEAKLLEERSALIKEALEKQAQRRENTPRPQKANTIPPPPVPFASKKTDTVSPAPIETDTTPPKIYLSYRGIDILPAEEETRQIQGRVEDESKVSYVKVNNVSAHLDASNNFSATIPVGVGNTQVKVIAVDIHGNSGQELFTIRRDETKNVTSTFNIAGTYHALVIGINDYPHLNRLQTAVKDANAIAELLKNKYSFQVDKIINQQATRKNIVSRLNKLRKNLSPQDKLLIYYAGHGYFDKETQKAYWLPIDAEKDDDSSWILADSITTNIKRIKTKDILVVSDSCYSGTLTRDSNIRLNSKTTRNRYIEKMLKKNSRVLIASGGNEPVTDSGGNGHSIFAQAFIDALNEVEEKVFTAEELFVGYIKETVAGSAEQTPEYSIIRNSGHKGGDFVFKKR